MRVLDNLENYDIPSGFHLTAEQEEQLAAYLKGIALVLLHTPCAACVKESEVGLHCKGKLVDKNLLESGNIVLLVED